MALHRSESGPIRERVADWVYERLTTAIFEQELEPGEHLSVPALAEQLAVSRSPVREAVQRLVSERLAKEEPHRGAVVAHIRTDELQSLYEVREVLEGLAARLAAGRIDSGGLAQLRSIFDEDRRTVARKDYRGHIDLDQAFHAHICEMAANPWLDAHLKQIRGQVRLAMASTVITAGPEHALRDHAAILAAIANGDPEEAELLSREHIARLRTALRPPQAEPV